MSRADITSKRPVYLTTNPEWGDVERREQGTLSRIFEQSTNNSLVAHELARWKEENGDAFASYNCMIAERGSIAEELGFLL